MKRLFALLIFVILVSTQSFAHFIWVETDQQGELNKEQEIKIFFGEFSYGKYEKAEGRSFSRIKDFELYIMNPKGEKIDLNAKPNGDHYLAKFTPNSEGTFTVVLNHDKIPVYDLSKYGHGVFKANYHATSKIQVGKKIEETFARNPESITIKNLSDTKDTYKLQVWYKGEVLKNSKVHILAPDNWSKTLKTDENGMISFTLPWKSTFVIEAVFKQEDKGVYMNAEYDYIFNCCTLSIQN